MLTPSNYREIHLSDLIRAHEGNPDFHDEDPNKIHWAKFNMMGRFIDAITQCQAGCRETGTFNFQPKPQVRALLMFDQPQYLMDEEVGRCHLTFLLSMYAHVCISQLQRSRTSLPEIENVDDTFRPGFPRTFSRDYPPHSKDGAILKKIFFW